MRAFCVLVFFVAGILQTFGQAAPSTLPDLPKDPHAILAMAAPFYDFNDPALKPWHLKATYQLYDKLGKRTEQGTYEYWWASPKVYRSSWTRPSGARTEWHTADGKSAFKESGETLKYFEKQLEYDIFSPLPDSHSLNPAVMRLDLQERSDKGSKYPCISLTRVPGAQFRTAFSQPFSIYCFDPRLPVLLGKTVSTVIATEFNNVVKMQGKFLAREILVFVERQKIFSASIDAITGISSSDQALTPDSGAQPITPDSHPSLVTAEKANQMSMAGITIGQLIKKEQPAYPFLAKRNHEQGTVLLHGIIGKDGKVRDLEVISAPSDSLAASAVDAVAHWEYKPYLLNGEPVEVETTINVIFTLGG